MTGVKFNKQKQMEKEIRGYLEPAETRRTWAELLQKAKKDGIPKATLGRYLNKFQTECSVKREVDTTRRPARTYYSLNLPLPLSRLGKQEELRLPAKQMVESWNRELLDYAKKMETVSRAQRQPGMPPLFTFFASMLNHIVAVHLWASSFSPEKLNQAQRYLRSEMMSFVETYCGGITARSNIGHLMTFREPYLRIAEAFITHTLGFGYPDNEQWTQELRRWLRFKPAT
jgi:hypothetical protein